VAAAAAGLDKNAENSAAEAAGPSWEGTAGADTAAVAAEGVAQAGHELPEEEGVEAEEAPIVSRRWKRWRNNSVR